MTRFALLILIFCWYSLPAQKIPLINSGVVLDRAKELYDSAKYAASIQEFLKVPERDTNYVVMQKEIAFSYIANLEFDKAIQVANQGLAKPSEYRSEFLRARASATSRKGDLERGLVLYDEAMKEFPGNVSLLYSLGLVYYEKKSYEKAVDVFFKILAMNPFHTGSHLHLGLLSILEGRKVNAMLSMGIYLSVATKDNNRLVLMNNFVDNQVTDESTVTPFGTNSSDKLDQIIRAKIALEKNFKSNIPIPAAVTKQYELLFDQLGMISPTADSPWVKYYLPIYEAIKRQQLTEPFIYHLLVSSSNEIASKWRSKNDDALKSFFSATNIELKKKREYVSLPGFSKPVKAWYSDNNTLEAVGEETSAEVRQGPWVFFFDSGLKRSAGNYNASGAKEGTWTYHYSNGVVKSVENYVSGEVTVYNKDGIKSEHFFLTNDKIQGTVETFFPCGPISARFEFSDGERHGKLESFHADGSRYQQFAYNKGKVTGEIVTYYPGGKLKAKEIFKDGISQGPYVSYHRSGKIDAQGEYKDDVVVGLWKYYHSNGKLERSGKYSLKGMGVGEWVYYDSDGVLTEKRNFDEEGRLHGENSFFHHGLPSYTLQFKKDLMVKSTSFDRDGKVLQSYGANDGTFSSKYFYSTGQVMAEGNYVKGKKDGQWKYYYRYGKLSSESTYKDGLAQGKARNYYPSGSIKEEKEFVDDELNGYLIGYFQNGKISQEGWFVNGNREQQWFTYYSDGSLETDYYYLKGKLLGEAYDYSLDSKKYFTSTHGTEGISNPRQYGPDGEQTLQHRRDDMMDVYEELYADKKVRERFIVLCGKYEKTISKWYPDGGLFSKSDYIQGERDGNYEFREMDGTLGYVGSYVNGSRSGLWKQYHDNGQLFSEGYYLDGERDSIWAYHFDNGKPSSVGNYRGDLRNGVFRSFSPTGIPILEKDYDDDDIVAYRTVNPDGTTGPWVKFSGNNIIDLKYGDGTPAWFEEFKDGKRHGRTRLYYPGGQLHSMYNYRSGDDHGPYEVYFPNGKLKEKGSFVDDLAHGVVETYREDGSLWKTESFVLGTLNGPSKHYDAKGKIVREFYFWSGNPQK